MQQKLLQDCWESGENHRAGYASWYSATRVVLFGKELPGYKTLSNHQGSTKSKTLDHMMMKCPGAPQDEVCACLCVHLYIDIYMYVYIYIYIYTHTHIIIIIKTCPIHADIG
ncbi:Hypothetical predicted protein [Octopus vulgaris]|uniref:Uncharacterized protein n=1 Tax=Octopus vulgaris TaxID=6645 RepID=A0AA36AVK7_OCTVU|nr:Hypothetical predicted protein [Octopus vulgaris]